MLGSTNEDIEYVVNRGKAVGFLKIVHNTLIFFLSINCFCFLWSYTARFLEDAFSCFPFVVYAVNRSLYEEECLSCTA